MSAFLARTLTLGVIGTISLTVTVLAVMGVRWHLDSLSTAAFRDPSTLLGFSQFTTQIVVYAVNKDENTLTAIMRSTIADQDIPIVFKMAPGFRIERRNAVIENSIVVGASTTSPATLDDLVQGTRGFGAVRLDLSGNWTLLYLLIGDPFPRP